MGHFNGTLQICTSSLVGANSKEKKGVDSLGKEGIGSDVPLCHWIHPSPSSMPLFLFLPTHPHLYSLSTGSGGCSESHHAAHGKNVSKRRQTLPQAPPGYISSDCHNPFCVCKSEISPCKDTFWHFRRELSNKSWKIPHKTLRVGQH